jgi:lipid-binding SYLF domain-containing protein
MRRSLYRSAQAVALALVAFFIGCSKPQRTQVTVPLPPELPRSSSAAQVAQPAKLSATEERLHRVGDEMEKLISQPAFSLPDAVLNRTACAVVFPSDEGDAVALQGFASCRNSDGQWTSPVVMNLVSSSKVRFDSDLYIFVLSDRARRRLVSGNLELRSPLRISPGPTRSTRAILDQVTASRDVFAYSVANGELRGVVPREAKIVLNAGETQKLYGHPLDSAQLLSEGTMSSTVTSFYRVDVASLFNTITPAGIIIHHSVLIPGGDLPEAERALDRFHYARGYEISCFGKVYHIAYHYLILPDGRVVSGRPERCEGAHARGYNSYLGIALVGDFSSHTSSGHTRVAARPTKAQMAALIRLCCYLRQKYSIPLQRIMPHNAVSRTECPGEGFEFNTVLAAVSRESGAGS